MMRPSALSLGTVVKQAARLFRHPRLVVSLVALERERRFVTHLRPGTNDGIAQNIRQLSIRLTDVCNLRCRTCGQWGDRGFLNGRSLRELREVEVPVGRYHTILADLVEHGHRPSVYFWGGEPMLYGGILELIERTAALDLPVAIATNGTHVAGSAGRLVDAPLFLLQMSIDGHTAPLHDRIRPGTGPSSNFADIESGLDAIRSARRSRRRTLPVVASLTVISEENVEHLVDIYEVFRDRVDLFVFYLGWWIDAGASRAHEEDFSSRFGFTPHRHRGWIGSWVPTDFAALDRQLRDLQQLQRRWNAPPVVVLPAISGVGNLRAYYTDHGARFGFDRCESIYYAVEINSNGDLSPCRDYHDFVVGNIKEASITNLWNSPAYLTFRRSLATSGLMPVCSRCCGLMGY